jgi:hypothetical protein
MEGVGKKINQKITSFLIKFKNDINEKVNELKLDNDKRDKLLKFMYDYERLTIEKHDLQKRKRVKNIVPIFDRCIAKRACGEQCTRRKKNPHQLCGTHIKGTPHGVVEISETQEKFKKIEIWAEDIKGIIYYIDTDFNVYNPKDIFENKVDPRIIAKWQKNNEGEYIIS